MICEVLMECTLSAHLSPWALSYQPAPVTSPTHTHQTLLLVEWKAHLRRQSAAERDQTPHYKIQIQKVLHFNSEIKLMRLNNSHKCINVNLFFSLRAGRGEEMTWLGKGMCWTKGRNVPGLPAGVAGKWLTLWEVKLHGTCMCTQPTHHHPSEPAGSKT